jgi:ubiquitin C-terminal hydrolase
MLEMQQKQNQLNELMNKIKQAEFQLKNSSQLPYKPQPKPPKPLSPIRTYEKPTLIGLNNIGATCFMNATLQCFSQTKALTNYFLKPQNKSKIINNNIANTNKNEPQLSPIYLELINKLWAKNSYSKNFSPTIFMNTIEEMNPLFKQGQPGDSKDFIIFILEQFHKELKKAIKNKITPDNTNKTLNQYDKEATLAFFIDDFMKETSIISDLFFGIIETTNVCLFCKRNYNAKGMNNPIVYNYQKNNLIIFPLEEVKNYKNNFMRNNHSNFSMYQNNIVSIYECFYYYQKTDTFTGQNQNYCNICQQLNDSLYTTRLYTGPNILIIILNRGKDNVFNVKLDFSERIDISDFIIAKEKPRIEYDLYGVISHIGKSGPSAHFVASCKSPVDNHWYRYNDSIVNPINDFRKDILDFATPYVLFYQKI